MVADDPFADLLGGPSDLAAAGSEASGPAARPAAAHEDPLPLGSDNGTLSGHAPPVVPLQNNMYVMLKEDARDYIHEAVAVAVDGAVQREVGKFVGGMREVLVAVNKRTEKVESEVSKLHKTVATLDIDNVLATLNARFTTLDDALRDLNRSVQVLRDRAELMDMKQQLDRFQVEDKKGSGSSGWPKKEKKKERKEKPRSREPEPEEEDTDDEEDEDEVPVTSARSRHVEMQDLKSRSSRALGRTTSASTVATHAPSESTHTPAAAAPPPPPPPPPPPAAAPPPPPASAPAAPPAPAPSPYAPPGYSAYDPAQRPPGVGNPFGAYGPPPNAPPAMPGAGYASYPPHQPPPAPPVPAQPPIAPSSLPHPGPPPPMYSGQHAGPRYHGPAPQQAPPLPQQSGGQARSPDVSQVSTQSVISDICQMGFPRARVEAVLQSMLQQGKGVDLNAVVDVLMEGQR